MISNKKKKKKEKNKFLVKKHKTIDMGEKRKNTGQFILGQAHMVLFS